MCVCAIDGFSLGVFLRQSRVCILLCDHPGMHTVLREIHGTMLISCMGQLEVGGGQWTGALPQEKNFQPLLQDQEQEVRPTIGRTRIPVSSSHTWTTCNRWTW
jgi:hypothetical protein